MQRPLVSVIIPVFNAEAYIEKGVRSVMSQTLNEIEIIVINDGSTDKSLAIINKLAEEDSRIKVYSLQNNGVSAARNQGIENATGKYIGFVDADDWVEETMFEKMYLLAESEKCDWIVCNIQVEYTDGRTATRLKLQNEVLDMEAGKKNELQKLMQFKYDNANWNKLYAAEIIDRKKIRFNEGMQLWEDLLFNLVYLQFSTKMATLNETLCHYQIQEKSLTGQNIENSIENYNRLYTGYENFIKNEDDAGAWEIFRNEMARGCYNQLLNKLAVETKSKAKNKFQFFAHYYRDIKKFNPAIFYFKGNNLFNFQGFKKSLLVYRCFFLFTVCIVPAQFFKKT